jgi:hypothetical protein
MTGEACEGAAVTRLTVALLLLDSAQLRDIDRGLIDLFVDGKEDCLPDAGRLDELGLGSGSVVFMLHRLGWRWDACGSGMALSEDGLVATQNAGFIVQLVTGGAPMTEGRHYWEVAYTSADATEVWFLVGAVRPGLDHDNNHMNGNDAYFIHGCNGSLWGNGKCSATPQGNFAMGDRIGVLLDLDAGWMHIYRNGKRYGPGFAEGVTGPLVRAAQLDNTGYTMTVLPGAVVPEGTGGADEPESDY